MYNTCVKMVANAVTSAWPFVVFSCGPAQVTAPLVVPLLLLVSFGNMCAGLMARVTEAEGSARVQEREEHAMWTLALAVYWTISCVPVIGGVLARDAHSAVCKRIERHRAGDERTWLIKRTWG